MKSCGGNAGLITSCYSAGLALSINQSDNLMLAT
jgi:hypothetical protein